MPRFVCYRADTVRRPDVLDVFASGCYVLGSRAMREMRERKCVEVGVSVLPQLWGLLIRTAVAIFRSVGE